MPDEHVYTLKVTEQPDEDGDYRTRIYVDGAETADKTFFTKDREDGIRYAKAWVEWHRAHEETEETIQL